MHKKLFRRVRKGVLIYVFGLDSLKFLGEFFIFLYIYLMKTLLKNQEKQNWVWCNTLWIMVRFLTIELTLIIRKRANNLPFKSDYQESSNWKNCMLLRCHSFENTTLVFVDIDHKTGQALLTKKTRIFKSSKIYFQMRICTRR